MDCHKCRHSGLKEGMKFLSGDVVRICEEMVSFQRISSGTNRGQTKWQRGGTIYSTFLAISIRISIMDLLLFTKGDVPRRGREEADRLTADDFGPYVDYERPYLRAVAYSVWDITPVNSPRLDEKHAAPFPEEIPRRLMNCSLIGRGCARRVAGAGTSLRIAEALEEFRAPE